MQEVIDAINHYKYHPVTFVEEIVGASLDDLQKEILVKLVEEHFIAIRSGSGIGKTFILSMATLWFLFTRPKSKVPSTAPSQHQLYDVLWSEHYKWIDRSPILGKFFTWTQTRLAVKGHEPNWYAVARTAQVKPGSEVAEGLQGFHDEENILFIIDEACHDDQTEVLTDHGWKFFENLVSEDQAFTLDPDTGVANYQKPAKYYKSYRKDKMIQMTSKTADFCVTPNHELFFRIANAGKPSGFSDWRRTKVQDMIHPVIYMKKDFIWKGREQSTFTIPSYYSIKKRNDVSEKEVDMKEWCEFLGWYLAEGNIQGLGNCVKISQYGEDTKTEIALLAELLGFDPHINERDVSIYSSQLASVLEACGNGASNKRVPEYIKQLSPKYIEAFLRGYGAGDGHITKDGAIRYSTTSMQLANDVHELILKAGHCASLSIYDRVGQIAVNSKGGPSRSNYPEYRVNQYSNNTSLTVKQREHFKYVDYSGYVYCIQVPQHHLIFTRRNGFCMWSGNSGVPDAIYPAVEGALTGSVEGTFCILAGNPTRKEGFFYDVFNNSLMAKYYHHIHVSCYDSPRVSERWLDMMDARYGKGHPIHQIKVEGEFPTAGIKSLIPPDYIDQMENNTPNDVKSFPVEFGLDVGRTHAASVLCIRQSLNVLKWDERQKKGKVTDTNEICEWVIGYINEFNPTSIKIDAIGIGAGVHDNLKLIYGNMIVAVIGSQHAEEEFRDRYLNLRAQGYWELREKIPFLYCKRWPDRVISELGNINTVPTSNAKIKVESKDDMLARAMKSPDYADAMYYAFLNPDACTGVKIVVFVPPPKVLIEANKTFKKTPIWQIDRNERRFGREPGTRWKGFDV